LMHPKSYLSTSINRRRPFNPSANCQRLFHADAAGAGLADVLDVVEMLLADRLLALIAHLHRNPAALRARAVVHAT